MNASTPEATEPKIRYTIKDGQGKTFAETQASHGILDSQIEGVAKILDVHIKTSADEPGVITVYSPREALKSEDVLIGMTVLQHIIEHNKKRELSMNVIKAKIKELRATLRAQKAERHLELVEGFVESVKEFASVGAGTALPRSNATLQKLIAKIHLTEFRHNGDLVFDPVREEIWPPTPSQKIFIRDFPHHAALVLKGPAGSGKTDFTVRMILGMLVDGEIEKIILSAPVDEGGEEIGFRKGDDREKMNGHINQILRAIDGHLGRGDFKAGEMMREQLLKAGIIEITNLGTISGINLRRTALIVDEAHKAKMPHLLLCLSRVHHDGSKVVLMGDERQHMSAGVSDFRDFTKRFAHPAYKGLVAQITYNAEDIRRHRLAQTMAERGDDIPPGLAQRMLEEQITPEKRAILLRSHFTASAAKTGKPDPLSEKLAQEMIRRMKPEEVYALLHEQVHGEPPALDAPRIDAVAPSNEPK